jgi:predicted  nucleic acid-binding Zn-ribbon protein
MVEREEEHSKQEKTNQHAVDKLAQEIYSQQQNIQKAKCHIQNLEKEIGTSEGQIEKMEREKNKLEDMVAVDKRSFYDVVRMILAGFCWFWWATVFHNHFLF